MRNFGSVFLAFGVEQARAVVQEQHVGAGHEGLDEGLIKTWADEIAAQMQTSCRA